MFNLINIFTQPLQGSSGSGLCPACEFVPRGSPATSWGLPEQKLYSWHLLLHLTVRVLMATVYHHLGMLPFLPGKSPVSGPSGLIHGLGSLETILFMIGFVLPILDYLLKCYGLFLNLKKVSFQVSTFLWQKAQPPLNSSLGCFLLSQGHLQLLFTLLYGLLFGTLEIGAMTVT